MPARAPKDLGQILAAPPAWLGRLEDYYWLHDLLRVSVGVPAWAVVWDGGEGLIWRDLSLVLPPLAPYHFETALGREGERDAYYRRQMRKALDTGKPLQSELHACRDLFVPVGKLGRGGVVLYFGQYLGAAPDYDALGAAWTRMSQRAAAPGDADFEAFVSAALRLPILPEPAVQGLMELGRLLGAHLRGELPRTRLEPRLERLRKQAFAPWLPHPVWAYQAIGYDKQRPTPWHPGRELNEWMKRELGLSRPPTTVLALLPLHAEPARARVAGRALLSEAWAWCRKQGGATPAALGEDGLLLLVETDPKASQAQSRVKLRRWAEGLRDLARQRLGMDSAVGIGEPVPLGERLFPSHQQALLALETAVQEGQRLRFFHELKREPGPFSYVKLARSARALAEGFEQGASAGLRLEIDAHVSRVLEYAAGRVDLARGQFLAASFLCLEAAGRRQGLGPAQLDPLSRSLAEDLERSRGMVDLLRAYNDGMHRLGALAQDKGPGARGLALQGFVAWLQQNLGTRLSLAQAAAQAGLSVPAFTRAFRRATGTALGPYLRRLRVERAASLLRGSDLSLADVASRCGFSGSHQLIRLFRQQFKQTPGAYRARQQNR
jgi:AraC-like DNA-binding protein